MAFSGDVSVMGLDEVIGFLGSNGLGGVLTVANAACSLTLYLRSGVILCPVVPPKRKSGRIDQASLAAILSRGAKLSKSSGRQKALGSKASQKQTETRKRVGSGPTRKALPPDVLEKILGNAAELDRDVLALKVEETIQQVLLWYPARFDFKPGELPRHVGRDFKAGRCLELEPNSLLMEAARRRDNTKRHVGIKESLEASAEAEATKGAAHRDLQGDLAGIGLAAVLQSLNGQRRSGTLSVFTHDREESLHFQNGEAFVLIQEKTEDAFAKDFLGESWMDQVKLADDFAQARAGMHAESDLTEAELRAVKDKFLDILFWDEAEFVFQKDVLPPEFHTPGDKVSKIALQTGRFLMEAIQRLTEWDGVRQVIGGGEAVLEFVDAESKVTQSSVLSMRGLQVMTLIDGRLSFSELVRLSGLEHLEVGRLVKELVEGGQLQIVDAAKPARS
jgi:hypothetical protein